jgi:hypothetical protein
MALRSMRSSKSQQHRVRSLPNARAGQAQVRDRSAPRRRARWLSQSQASAGLSAPRITRAPPKTPTPTINAARRALGAWIVPATNSVIASAAPHAPTTKTVMGYSMPATLSIWPGSHSRAAVAQPSATRTTVSHRRHTLRQCVERGEVDDARLQILHHLNASLNPSFATGAVGGPRRPINTRSG